MKRQMQRIDGSLSDCVASHGKERDASQTVDQLVAQKNQTQIICNHHRSHPMDRVYLKLLFKGCMGLFTHWFCGIQVAT